jgi:hypothetical protein
VAEQVKRLTTQEHMTAVVTEHSNASVLHALGDALGSVLAEATAEVDLYK